MAAEDPSGDVAQCRILLDALGGGPIPDDVVDRLDPEFQEGLLLVEQDGAAGLEAWLANVRARDSGRHDAIRAAIEAARARKADAPPPADPDAAIESPAGHGPRRWPTLAPGTVVMCSDRDGEEPNFGRVLEDYGASCLVRFLEGEPGQTDVVIAKCYLAYQDGTPLLPGAEGPAPIALKIYGSAEFDAADFEQRWHVQDLLVAGQPGIVGGPKKAMKSTLVVELAVALGAGQPVLGHFRVIKPTRCLVLNGESGAATLRETARRVCRSKRLSLGDLEGTVYWGLDLPQLSIDQQLESIQARLQELGIEVAFIDPLYLCLFSGAKRRIDPSNLFDIGPLLKKVAGTFLEVGVTPIMIHHMKKSRDDPFGPPELDDLSFAGVPEYARQWLLLNRREPYVPGTGRHSLWMGVGGSAGHTSLWWLDVEEGVIDAQFGGRTWSYTLREGEQSREEERGRRKSGRERAKEAARARKLAAYCVEALAVLRTKGPLTLTKWRNALNWSGERMGPVHSRLEDEGKVRARVIQIPSGRDKARDAAAWEAVEPGMDAASPQGPDELPSPDRDRPGQTGTDGHRPARFGAGQTGTDDRDGAGLSPHRGEPPECPGLRGRSEGVSEQLGGSS
jgi:hypothetical protein